MSRAFIKETDETVENLPDRPISSHPNMVTPKGFELIESALSRLRQEHALAQSVNDRAAMARIARDLRYWTSRHSTAEVVHPPNDAALVRFGCEVTIARNGDRRERATASLVKMRPNPAGGRFPTSRPWPGH